MRGKQGRRFLACALGLLTAVLLWRPVAGIAGDAPAVTNLGIVVRKSAPDRQSPDRRLPDRPRNAAPQSKLYFGSRVESVTTAGAPQNPYESNYTSVLRSYHKAIIGFRFALTSRAYLFVGVGMAVPDNLLEQGLGRNVSITAAQIQNALGMQTEYGLGWDF
ncbi:MAG: hypothetical protein L6437_15040 [Kiritimatiellae bacterium]|nr:hypothetical protein [Verrucomicrobiota bacterium]MBU4286500.1 hypothetical protein [Verrucomicrobiota bacterium]MBU4365620.1 hypothetical protein [Verrucomicrobiota bacterium]MCG2661548.1 hypothetical protein [Kiritimatiellia bacterium]